MSRTVVIILGGTNRDLAVGDCLRRKWEVRSVSRVDGGTDCQVHAADNNSEVIKYVNIGELLPRMEVLTDYKENEGFDENFRASLLDHVFYGVTYNDDALCNEVVSEMLTCIDSDLDECWIDTGYGKAVKVREFLDHGGGLPIP